MCNVVFGLVKLFFISVNLSLDWGFLAVLFFLCYPSLFKDTVLFFVLIHIVHNLFIVKVAGNEVTRGDLAQGRLALKADRADMRPFALCFPVLRRVLMGGGLLLGAIFMATDYTTSPVSFKGKIIFGIGCGLITSAIRIFGSYPEGVSFSIILMNILVPHIERLTTAKPFGTPKRDRKAEKAAKKAEKEAAKV